MKETYEIKNYRTKEEEYDFYDRTGMTAKTRKKNTHLILKKKKRK